MGLKTRLSSYCTNRANNGVNLVTSRNINTRLARPIDLLKYSAQRLNSPWKFSCLVNCGFVLKLTFLRNIYNLVVVQSSSHVRVWYEVTANSYSWF